MRRSIKNARSKRNLKNNGFCLQPSAIAADGFFAPKKTVSAKILSNFARKIFDIVRTMIYNAFCLLNVNKKFK